MIKRECINEMFKRHFKSTLGPQDNENEPHPAIAHMYAVHITETMNVLQGWHIINSNCLISIMPRHIKIHSIYHFQNDNGVNE